MSGTAKLHIAVDAHGLAGHWRGIARYVEAVLAQWAASDAVRVTTVHGGPFGMRAPRSADAVWHPQNGTFFDARVPAVVTFHDAVPFRFPAQSPRKREHEQKPWLRSAATAARVIVNSRYTGAEIERFLEVPAAKQTVTYLGADRALFRPDGRKRQLPDGRPYVLAVTTREPFKNYATLAAAHRLAFPRAEVALVVAGDGFASDGRVHALGVVSPGELAGWYRGALATAVPSAYECFGLPVLESMASGTPVLASRVAALPEVAGDACRWIDEPEDAAAWSGALQETARDAERRGRLRAAGLERAGAFSWERCADETLAVFRRVIGGG